MFFCYTFFYIDSDIYTEGAIKNGQFRETGNIGYTRQRQTKQDEL
jgi:hypothetical protein